jgi:hypothetical protein
MKLAMLAAALLAALAMPANAAGTDDTMLKAGAEIILYYSVCTTKPFTAGARGDLAEIARRYGEEAFKRDIEGKVNSLLLEWTRGAENVEETAHGVFPGAPRCVDARKHWGRGLIPEGEHN